MMQDIIMAGELVNETIRNKHPMCYAENNYKYLTQLQATDPWYDLQDLVTGRVLQTELSGQETSQAA